jgi:hypothetical protein
MFAYPMDRYDINDKTATNLWDRLAMSCGDSEYLNAALDALAVRAGIRQECPDCERVWDWEDQVGPCELCADDE